jgi:ABC-type sugar transport system ATPase subunit
MWKAFPSSCVRAILGIGGLVGCGKEEVARAIVGFEPFPTGDKVSVKGKTLPLRGRGKSSIAADVGFVRKERVERKTRRSGEDPIGG